MFNKASCAFLFLFTISMASDYHGVLDEEKFPHPQETIESLDAGYSYKISVPEISTSDISEMVIKGFVEKEGLILKPVDGYARENMSKALVGLKDQMWSPINKETYSHMYCHEGCGGEKYLKCARPFKEYKHFNNLCRYAVHSNEIAEIWVEAEVEKSAQVVHFDLEEGSEILSPYSKAMHIPKTSQPDYQFPRYIISLFNSKKQSRAFGDCIISPRCEMPGIFFSSPIRLAFADRRFQLIYFGDVKLASDKIVSGVVAYNIKGPRVKIGPEVYAVKGHLVSKSELKQMGARSFEK